MSLRDHWPLHARQWALIGPPLRPDREDVAIVERAVAALAARRSPPVDAAAVRALLLGVTPELATMRWPAGTSLVAVDRSAAMIDAIFPRAGVPAGAVARRGEWLALPIADGAIDVVVGDGCLSNLTFPAGYRGLAAECRRVLDGGGRLVLRVFAAPEQPPSLAAVARALWDGRIASFHALKWRLAMAIQPADRNVAVADIRAAFEEVVADRAALAARTGWAPAVIDTIDAYRGSDLRYSFPTLREIDAALAEALAPVACHGGDEAALDDGDEEARDDGAARIDRYPTRVWTRRW